MSSVSATVAKADNLKGMLWMAAYAAFISSMHVCIRLVSADMHPFEIAFFRNLFALVVVVPWFWKLGVEPLRTKRLGLLVARGTLNTFCMLAYFTALSIGNLAEITALSFTAPIYATIIGMFVFGERVGIRRWVAILIGFAGVLVILRPGFQTIGQSQILVLTSAFGWAACMVMVKALGRTESAITITTYMSLVMTPLSLVPALYHWTWPTPEQYAWLLLLGALGGLGQLMMTQALRLGETHVITPIDFLRLVFMSLLGFLILDQVPDRFMWIGAMMIFSAVAFIAYREHVRRAAARAATNARAGPGGGT
ncbi:MAG: DMT family transporter [Rhodospirillaceae bacterium]